MNAPGFVLCFYSAAWICPFLALVSCHIAGHDWNHLEQTVKPFCQGQGTQAFRAAEHRFQTAIDGLAKSKRYHFSFCRIVECGQGHGGQRVSKEYLTKGQRLQSQVRQAIVIFHEFPSCTLTYRIRPLRLDGKFGHNTNIPPTYLSLSTQLVEVDDGSCNKT